MARKKKSSVEDFFDKVLSDHSLRRNLVQKSFEHFFPIYFHKYIEYEVAPFHVDLFRILQDESVKLAVIVAFRGSAKSTIITTAYVLWAILGVQQRKFIVIAGQTEQKARAYLTNIKNELLHNELLKRDLGPFEEERNSLGNATALIIKRLNVKIMITSVEQSIRGMRHGEHRPDLIILDDIEDINSVKTREGRNKTFDWLTGEMIPAGSRRTRIIAVGNLLHEDSVLKRLQRKIEAGEMNSLNAMYREYPIVDVDNNPLWPGKYPDTESVEAEKEKTGDEVSWYREYMLKIISTAEQVVQPQWIQTYSSLPSQGLHQIAIGVDLAISEKSSADCTAMVVGYVYGYGKNMKIYIQPNPTNAQLTFPEQVEHIKALHAVHKDKCYRVKLYIEDVGYQRALVQVLDTNRYDVVGVPTGRADKGARLRLTTSFIKEGRILFPDVGCEELIEQMVGFGKETHDDLADAFAIVVLRILEDSPRVATAGIGRPDAI
ncbi:phage terminase large subunit [Candidatus Nomurabacteria bacterium]|nr:phage terminase large subunit [Candidatus Nomurabacteria bacterium]